MDTIRSWILTFRDLPRERKLNCLFAALLILLLFVSVFAVAGQIKAVHNRNEVRSQLGQALYYDMNMLTQTFDMMDVPNADIEGVVLPQMRRYFHYSCALNDALRTGFGSRYAVMNGNDTDALDAAFTAFDNAFRQQQPTDTARQALSDAIAQTRQRMQQRFTNGRLKPGR